MNQLQQESDDFWPKHDVFSVDMMRGNAESMLVSFASSPSRYYCMLSAYLAVDLCVSPEEGPTERQFYQTTTNRGLNVLFLG